jgi:mono/diheme cytochrome c family protein
MRGQVFVVAVIIGSGIRLDAQASSTSQAPTAAWNRTRAITQSAGTPAERGAAVFNNWCTACHDKNPASGSGTRSLQNKYQGKVPAALEERTDLTPSAVKFAVRQGVATMPFFRKTEINDADLDALVVYLAAKR